MQGDILYCQKSIYVFPFLNSFILFVYTFSLRDLEREKHGILMRYSQTVKIAFLYFLYTVPV